MAWKTTVLQNRVELLEAMVNQMTHKDFKRDTVSVVVLGIWAGCRQVEVEMWLRREVRGKDFRHTEISKGTGKAVYFKQTMPSVKILPGFQLPSEYLRGGWSCTQRPPWPSSSSSPASWHPATHAALSHRNIHKPHTDTGSILHAFLLLLPLAWNRLSLFLILVNSYWSLKVKFKYKLPTTAFPDLCTPLARLGGDFCVPTAPMLAFIMF